jgi:hypothetical protein
LLHFSLDRFVAIAPRNDGSFSLRTERTTVRGDYPFCTASSTNMMR